MPHARYTQKVAGWQLRAVGALVMTILAGGPCIAILCDALCSGSPHSMATTGVTQSPRHHHGPADLESPSERVPEAAAVAHHVHHQPAATAADSFAEARIRFWRSSDRQCCGTMQVARASLAPTRTAAGVSLTVQASVRVFVSAFDPPAPRPQGPGQAPPPGSVAPARRPLVLRI